MRTARGDLCPVQPPLHRARACLRRHRRRLRGGRDGVGAGRWAAPRRRRTAGVGRARCRRRIVGRAGHERPPSGTGRRGRRRSVLHLLHVGHDRSTRRARCSPIAAGSTRRWCAPCRAASTRTTASCCRSRSPSRVGSRSRWSALWSGATLVLEPAFDPGRALRAHRGAADHRVHGGADALPADGGSPGVRRHRHLLDPLRVVGRRDRAGLVAADVPRPRHHDDADLLAHRGERVGHHACRTTRRSSGSAPAVCRRCTARRRSSTRTASRCRPARSARSPSVAPR